MTVDPSSQPPLEVEAALDRLIATADVVADRPPVKADIRDDSILGAILATPVLADRDHPPFDRATMDGYAIRARESKLTLPVVGSVPAGSPPPAMVPEASCVAIATGAAVPHDLDAVVEHETTDRSDPLTIPPGRGAPRSEHSPEVRGRPGRRRSSPRRHPHRPHRPRHRGRGGRRHRRGLGHGPLASPDLPRHHGRRGPADR